MRAADDFKTISEHIKELRRAQIYAEERTVNLNGETIGQCTQCKFDCVPCKGYCFDD